jgi:hypothetical protein
MQMSVQDKLRLHVAAKNVTWRTDVPGALAAAQWTDDAPHLLLAFDGPVSASRIVDAYNAGRGSHVTLVHEGPIGDVARRSAARFGITLLDLATLLPAHAVAPSLPAHEAQLALAPHVEAPIPPALPEPEPLVVPQLPWDLASPSPDPFDAAPTPMVTPHEMLAMPWTAYADEDEHMEITQTVRGVRGTTVRPSTDLHPDARHWGLPWPRPVSPADGLAIADPRIWNNKGRLDVLHADFDRQASDISMPPKKPIF